MSKQLLIGSLLLSLASTAYSDKAMQEVLNEQKIPFCHQEINSLAATVIGTKPHRILGHPQNHADNTLFTAIMALSYRDRESLVSFAASQNADGSCSVRYTESYALQVPCNMARQEVFKKWQYLGRLNNQNMVLQSKRHPSQRAFLSTALTNSGCLVNISDYYQAQPTKSAAAGQSE